jgi:hypothetical protein
MRFFCFVFLLGATGAAQAQAAAQSTELGLRYWYSEGKTAWSHNAQMLNPSLGNPTSILTYDGLKAHSVELHGRKSFNDNLYIKGYAGFGGIKSGSLDDEDFLAGQVKFMDTTSSVTADALQFVSIDLGADVWRFTNGKAGLFIGYHFWRESVDAYGIVVTVPPVGRTHPDSVLVISNEATWQSLRFGFAGTWNLAAPTRIMLDAAFVPRAHVRNEDSHWLRQSPNDLGPVPNVHSKGDGYGYQLELELRHQVQRNLEIGAGLRYWWLRARDGTHSQAGFDMRLRELESQRVGVMLSVTGRW